MILIFFFVFVWFMQNNSLISDLSYGNLVLMNNSAFGYNSLLAYCVIYPIIYLIFMNLMIPYEDHFTIVRHRNRSSLLKKMIFKIIITSFLFSFIHTSINIILTVYYFKINMIFSNSQFLYGSLLNLGSLTLFFIVVGFIYKIFYDIRNSVSLATLGTYLIIGTIYFFGKLLIPPDIWTPDKDLTILILMLEDLISSSGLLLIFMRQIGEVFILYLIASSIYFRKDFLQNDSR